MQNVLLKGCVWEYGIKINCQIFCLYLALINATVYSGVSILSFLIFDPLPYYFVVSVISFLIFDPFFLLFCFLDSLILNIRSFTFLFCCLDSLILNIRSFFSFYSFVVILSFLIFNLIFPFILLPRFFYSLHSILYLFSLLPRFSHPLHSILCVRTKPPHIYTFSIRVLFPFKSLPNACAFRVQPCPPVDHSVSISFPACVQILVSLLFSNGTARVQAITSIVSRRCWRIVA